MNPLSELAQQFTRRSLLQGFGHGIGLAAIAQLLGEDARAGCGGQAEQRDGAAPLSGLPHHPPKAKRMIVLWQGGGPSHVDLFDHKPGLEAMRLQELPESVRKGTRLSTMTASQGSYKILPPLKPFRQYGQSGRWLSELLPHTGGVADELCLVRSMHTEAVNHAPGVTLFMTGSQIPGRPSLGAWMTYGLGTLTSELPSFVVMTSSDVGKTCGQLFFDYYWGSGFLPSKYQGVRFRSGADPVLYLRDPQGLPRELRRAALDDLAELNRQHLSSYGDPEIDTRISQYEMAFRMQTSVPDLLEVEQEPQHVLEMYGPDVKRPGSFARNCLIARRLLERGTRFVQLMHSGWDQHNNLSFQLAEQCRDTDQPAAALVRDLKQRGMLEDTIVLWGTEFGRTVFVQGDINNPRGHGRDHFGKCYSVWLAGGGFRSGHSYGETDDFCYSVARDPVHVHDLQATILNQLGIDHERLTYRYQGRDFRLTDVHGKVVEGIV
jgi:hypothetical protein